MAEVKKKSKSLNDEAQGILDSVTNQAAQITLDARTKAQEIAGSAYDAMKNASLYEHTAKAMKRIIDGYADQYAIPQRPR